ncbi:MAG: hypothetical protein J07HX64_02326 [halophilic archaeon J07HX64]|nr:MAG: hypothetical protein J07HX64_02326 [halophilic archaeon J07HX64]
MTVTCENDTGGDVTDVVRLESLDADVATVSGGTIVGETVGPPAFGPSTPSRGRRWPTHLQ